MPVKTQTVHNGKLYYSLPAAARLLGTTTTKLKQTLFKEGIECHNFRQGGRTWVYASDIARLSTNRNKPTESRSRSANGDQSSVPANSQQANKPSSDAVDIQNCKVVFRCPKTWEALTHTSDPKVRYCSNCDRGVHLCNTEKDLAEAQSRNWCVAVKITPRDELPLRGKVRDRKKTPIHDTDPPLLLGDIRLDYLVDAEK